ncbi:hypothetical protein [Sphaerisporangium sp. NPDC051011]|uniref:hypothetical protein n=1 Tax=Sphaerisporangium sp. NPDC051011 TaxID=3155792 RepID=UPI0033FF06F4
MDGIYLRDRNTGRLGSPNADKITATNYALENLAIVEEFTGIRVRTDTQEHCTT